MGVIETVNVGSHQAHVVVSGGAHNLGLQLVLADFGETGRYQYRARDLLAADLFQYARDELCGDAEKAFIIGGAQIFTQGIDIATTILLTLLERDVDGDVFFPDFSEDDFSEVSRKTYPDAKEPFTVVTYTRKAEA